MQTNIRFVTPAWIATHFCMYFNGKCRVRVTSTPYPHVTGEAGPDNGADLPMLEFALPLDVLHSWETFVDADRWVSETAEKRATGPEGADPWVYGTSIKERYRWLRVPEA